MNPLHPSHSSTLGKLQICAYQAAGYLLGADMLSKEFGHREIAAKHILGIPSDFSSPDRDILRIIGEHSTVLVDRFSKSSGAGLLGHERRDLAQFWLGASESAVDRMNRGDDMLRADRATILALWQTAREMAVASGKPAKDLTSDQLDSWACLKTEQVILHTQLSSNPMTLSPVAMAALRSGFSLRTMLAVRQNLNLNYLFQAYVDFERGGRSYSSFIDMASSLVAVALANLLARPVREGFSAALRRLTWTVLGGRQAYQKYLAGNEVDVLDKFLGRWLVVKPFLAGGVEQLKCRRTRRGIGLDKRDGPLYTTIQGAYDASDALISGILDTVDEGKYGEDPGNWKQELMEAVERAADFANLVPAPPRRHED